VAVESRHVCVEGRLFCAVFSLVGGDVPQPQDQRRSPGSPAGRVELSRLDVPIGVDAAGVDVQQNHLGVVDGTGKAKGDLLADRSQKLRGQASGLGGGGGMDSGAAACPKGLAQGPGVPRGAGVE
jgi:hypothetical protein